MNRVNRIVALLLAVPSVGTLGFIIIEGWNFFDALYMAVITITTVGFSEVRPLSVPGRAFVIAYLVVGIGVFLYGVVQIGELAARAELRSWLGRNRMDSALKAIEDHFVVCGYGRMGRALCRHLREKNLRFVAVDRDQQALDECRMEGWPWIHGDATDDRTLINAGLERARGLAAVLTSDADNLYVVLSARSLVPSLQIISRATDEKSAAKIEKAGADRVISIINTSAAKMAQLMAQPNLEDFFEIIATPRGELDLAEIHVSADGPYTGQALASTKLAQRGVIIVGIRRANGELVLTPSGSEQIKADDRLIALGKSDALSQVIGT